MPETAYAPVPMLLTPTQVAEALGISPRGARLLAERRELRGVRVGKLWRFHPDDVRDYIDGQRERT